MGFWSRFKKKMTATNPWIAGLLNFFSWGLGYLYTRKKKILGLALTSFVIANTAASSSMVAGDLTIRQAVIIVGATYLFVSIALARDAYIVAKVKNRRAEAGE